MIYIIRFFFLSGGKTPETIQKPAAGMWGTGIGRLDYGGENGHGKIGRP